MNCREIIEELEKKYPLSIAEKWDNPGLIAGRWDKEIKTAYIALDATKEVIRHASEAGADLLLTHHPMLMQPKNKINTGDFYGERLIYLIQRDICYYAMHTNYDIVEMASLAADMLEMKSAEVLEETCQLPDGSPGGFGRIGFLPEKMTLAQCGAYVKKIFSLPGVKLFGDPDTLVYRAAILPGSGKSMVDAAIEKGAEVYISGDFGHHDGIDAVDRGLCVIDAGHYGIEHIYIGQMEGEMRRRFPEITVISEPIAHPFRICVQEV